MARIGPERDGEHMHFEGFLVMALGAVGLVSVLRRRDGHTWRDDVHEGEEPVAARRHRELRLLVLAGAVSVVLALGPEVYGVTTPFGLMHDHLPGFGGIRVAARLAVVAWLTLAVLAGYGFAVLTRRLRGVVRPAVAVLACAVILVELAAPVFTAACPRPMRHSMCIGRSTIEPRNPSSSCRWCPRSRSRSSGRRWSRLACSSRRLTGTRG